MQSAWAEDIRDQCLSAHAPFFFRQRGSRMPKENGRIFEKGTWDEMPVATIRQPEVA